MGNTNENFNSEDTKFDITLGQQCFEAGKQMTGTITLTPGSDLVGVLKR